MSTITDLSVGKVTPSRRAAVAMLAAHHPARVRVSNVTRDGDPSAEAIAARPAVYWQAATWLVEKGLVDQLIKPPDGETVRLAKKGLALAATLGIDVAGAPAAPAPKERAAGEVHHREPPIPLDFEPPSGPLAMGALNGLVARVLECATGPVGPVAIGLALGRSSGAVTNALMKMVASGAVVEVSAKPRRFALASKSVAS